MAELKEECKRINATKRFIDTVHGDPVKLLKLGGNRQDVIARLKEEASLFLNARTTTSAATNFEISDVVMQLSGDDSDEDLSNGRYEERKQENISKKIKHGQSPPNSKDGDEVGVGDLHSILRLKFGLADFRPGQRWTNFP